MCAEEQGNLNDYTWGVDIFQPTEMIIHEEGLIESRHQSMCVRNSIGAGRDWCVIETLDVMLSFPICGFGGALHLLVDAAISSKREFGFRDVLQCREV
mmetsp:Transcript_22521/g.46952  ORF Transcript_22521/g.46952 Transcript_22521/m.46952 type:complete len:98 (+) Transcript_22521:1032-1325(+)